MNRIFVWIRLNWVYSGRIGELTSREVKKAVFVLSDGFMSVFRFISSSSKYSIFN